MDSEPQTSPIHQRGFTFLELIVVIIIILLVIAIFVTFLGQVREKGRDTARYQQALEILNALEMYHVETGGYPIEAGTTPVTLSNIGPEIQAYLSRIPDDPLYAPANGYHYCAAADGKSMAILINTERDKGGSNFCVISRGPKAYIENVNGNGVCDYPNLSEQTPPRTLDEVERCVSRIKN